jgi:hypothetical protein
MRAKSGRIGASLQPETAKQNAAAKRHERSVVVT